jgi:hypothetical protein
MVSSFTTRESPGKSNGPRLTRGTLGTEKVAIVLPFLGFLTVTVRVADAGFLQPQGMFVKRLQNINFSSTRIPTSKLNFEVHFFDASYSASGNPSKSHPFIIKDSATC